MSAVGGQSRKIPQLPDLVSGEGLVYMGFLFDYVLWRKLSKPRFPG